MAESKAGSVGTAGPLTNRILNQRYELLERVGGGGMAVVYRARDIALGGRIVALKVLREQYAGDEKFLARFTREASAAAGLNHPNIVNVYDVGEDGEIHYIVMEYVAGETLRQYMDRQAGPLTPTQAAEIAAQVCAALAVAHSLGIVHRDIKPQNVLISNQGVVKVTDFGIAKGLSEISMTETGVALGTVQYFSPEQARGQRVSPQSDLYSVGIILFEMLTARLPFESDSMMGLALKHVQEQPPHPRQFNPAVPPGLDAIVMKALEKQPQDRFASAEAMERALRNYQTFASQPAATEVLQPKPDPYAATTYFNPPRQQPLPPRQQYVVPPVVPVAPLRRASNYIEAEKTSGVGWATWIIGALILALLVGGVVFATTVLPTLGNQQNPNPGPVAVATDTPGPPPATPLPATVPDVTGKSQQDAATLLTQAGYQVQIVTATSASVPFRSVISQDPAPGTSLDRGKPVTITVSIGPRRYKLTDYRNTDATASQKQLADLGMKVTIQQQQSTAPPGVVIGQNPDPGTTVSEGDTVILIVSNGTVVITPQPPTTVQVPVVAGLTVDQASAIIQQAGLVPVQQTLKRGERGIDPSVYDANPKGTVLDTDPAQGVQVAIGSQVTLYVKQDNGGGNTKPKP